jgi:hypothetical protein
MQIFIAWIFTIFVGVVVTALATTLIIWFIAIFKEMYDLTMERFRPNEIR